MRVIALAFVKTVQYPHFFSFSTLLLLPGKHTDRKAQLQLEKRFPKPRLQLLFLFVGGPVVLLP